MTSSVNSNLLGLFGFSMGGAILKEVFYMVEDGSAN